MNNTEFSKIAETTIAYIADKIEEQDKEASIDVDLQGDILNLDTDKGVYVINKQSAAKEIWLSSPVSGPYHFFYEQGKWKNRAGLELMAILAEELSIDFNNMKGFETADSVAKVYDLIIKKTPANTLISIFLDIDDTIITPKSKTFRAAPYNQIIDRIKENKSNYDNYEEIVSNWRLQRKVMLIDKKWIDVINKLKAKFPVYGLTQMNTGEFGNIPSMQDWRYKELKELGIEFSDNKELAAYNSGQKDDAIFYKGIFITGNHSKSGTLSKFSKDLNARFIVFVDDRTKHVEDVRDYCKKNNIGFLGILFDGLKNLKDESDPKLAEFQESYLIGNAKWLEDEEAYYKLQSV